MRVVLAIGGCLEPLLLKKGHNQGKGSHSVEGKGPFGRMASGQNLSCNSWSLEIPNGREFKQTGGIRANEWL